MRKSASEGATRRGGSYFLLYPGFPILCTLLFSKGLIIHYHDDKIPCILHDIIYNDIECIIFNGFKTTI